MFKNNPDDLRKLSKEEIQTLLDKITYRLEHFSDDYVKDSDKLSHLIDSVFIAFQEASKEYLNDNTISDRFDVTNLYHSMDYDERQACRYDKYKNPDEEEDDFDRLSATLEMLYALKINIDNTIKRISGRYDLLITDIESRLQKV